MGAYLHKHNVEGRILKFESHTVTVEDAQRQLRTGRENIIKSMLFVDENGIPIIAIVTGDRKVCKEKLARIYGAEEVKIARSRNVKSLTGYEAGALPPIGHRQPIRTIIDSKVMTLKRVFGGGGDINALLEIDPRDIERLTNARVESISE